MLNDSSNEELKFATKNWCVIDSQTTKDKYKEGDTIKSETETIKSSLCDYSEAFGLVTGNITVNADNNADVAFKSCSPFSTCNNADLSIDNSDCFKYKAALVGTTTNHNNGNSFVKNTKLVVPLKYLSNFWRSLEKPLIKCKVHLELN